MMKMKILVYIKVYIYNRIATVLRNLGCKVDTVKSKAHGSVTKKASLVVPLKFPEISRGRR